ncbi:MAG TPA: sugar phosphate nucleotidyltransferase [Acidimicrobiales bacterium]|nr:sugar phosphate nucleotidyltransferase [Acidimicrobiales bacterium]
MKAVIMAGGEGTRLRPLTSNAPKPMIPLANRPMMEHIVELLKRHGFDDIVVTVAFLPHAIRTYFGDGSEFGVRMVYATEETPLGTAGSVRNAMDELRDERFLVISGDVLTDIDLSAVVRFHEERGALATIALKAMEDPLEFGIVITRDDGSIERFLEKPTWGQVFSDTINTGIYVLEPEVFDHIEGNTSVDFSSDVFPRLLEGGKPLFGYVADGYWEDVGTLDAYVRAHRDVLDGKVEISVPGFELGRGVWIGEGCDIDPTARVDGPAIIGDYARVQAGAHLSEYTVLGSNVNVGADAYLERSVVDDNAYLGAGVRLRGAVIGRGSDLRQGARCEEGVVVGDECVVGEHAVINRGVKVYPFKTVEAGAVVNSSIVWESRGARHLFGREGISGLANVDIGPELAVRVAMAFGTTLKKGAEVVTSRDSSRAARTLKRAMMAGLNAAGVDVADLEVAPIPVTRYQVRSSTAGGGVTVRLDPSDPQSVALRFMDANGLDLDAAAQRKIERLFYREDFRRAFAADIGDIDFPPRALESYTAALMSTVDARAVRGAGFKVVLDYAFGTTSFVMPNVLAKLGAEVLAVNPYAATSGALGVDRAAHAERLRDLVRSSGADLGAVIDPDGERITLVDDRGRVVADDAAVYALLHLLCQSADAPVAVALPVAASRELERVAVANGAHVVWTKLSTPHLMEVADSGQVALAASLDGGFIWPAFLPAYDATATLVNVMALLARTGLRLSKVVDGAPTSHIVHEVVPTPWEQKGLVMRTIVETAEDEVVLVDGVKVVTADGWALVVPDPELPSTHVWAEAATDDDARSLALAYVRRIRQLLR